MINWQVRSVSYEAVDAIKGAAKNRGLSMGQFLDWHFTQDIDVVKAEKFNGVKEYKISMSADSMNKLRRKAANNGYGVAKYLQVIANDEL